MRMAVLGCAALGVASALFACQWFVTLDAKEERAIPGPDVVTVADTAAPSLPPECGLEIPPPVESAPQGDPSKRPLYVFRHVNYLHREDAGEAAKFLCPNIDHPGYDLDECRSGSPTCDASSWPSCQERDQQIRELIPSMLTLMASRGEGDPDEETAAGTRGVLVEIRGFNGEQNVKGLSLVFYSASGLEPPDGGLDAEPPRFDGTDRWSIDRLKLNCEDASSSCTPPPVTTILKAYVTDGILVARFGELEIEAGFKEIRFPLRVFDGVVTARVAELPNVQGPWPRNAGFVNGRLAGRIAVADMLSLAKDINSSSGNRKIGCSGLEYDVLKGAICEHRDLAARKSADRAGHACSALSVGVGFAAWPVLRGVDQDGDAGRSRCAIDEDGGWDAACP